MTPDDLAAMSPDGLDSRLAAIRARDAAAIFTTFTDLTLYQQSIRDRRALLAEVDRLEVALEREMDASNAALADVDRLYGVVDDVYRAVNEAEIAERARIRAAVEGLRVKASKAAETDYFIGYRQSRNETVSAVLAAIDGGRIAPLGGIEQYQDEDR